MADDADTLDELKEQYTKALDAESDQREQSLADLEFARAAIQWPEAIAKTRRDAKRPMLTINKLPAFIRQVVNDARQNRPDIKIKPSSGGNVPTAEVFAGIVKNIEATSRADIAYDTASDFAVSCGLGYFRVDIEYENSMSFDKKLSIKRIPNVFSVVGDPHSKEPDSSDWNFAYVIDTMSKDVFNKEYKGAEPISWEDDGYSNMQEPWRVDDDILICEAWCREKTKTEIVMLTNGQVMTASAYKESKALLDAMGATVKASRKADGWKIIQRLMNGAEILDRSEWAGKYIPIIPVYGEEINIEGKRRFNSLIWSAKDAQRMFNYWRTTSTELVALAPRIPYIGEEGAFDVDGELQKWQTVNTENHPFLQYKKGLVNPPQRQDIGGGPAIGAMSEAMAAGDDIKAVIGMFDASLGQKSNETSGKAIMARQHEGDVSTFHFVDNLSRAIRHCGNILVDLIPLVYTPGRIVRVVKPDKSETSVKLTDQPVSNPNPLLAGGAGQPPNNAMPTMGDMGSIGSLGAGSGPSPASDSGLGAAPPIQPQSPMAAMPPGAPGPTQGPVPLPPEMEGVSGVYNLGAGTYDVVVDTGPSYTTRREEVAAQMMELVKQAPELLPIIGDILVQSLDWPRAQEIADRIKQHQAQGKGIPPELQKQIKQGMDRIKQLEQENMLLKAKIPQHMADHEIDKQQVRIDEYDAETRRLAAINADNRAVESNIMDFHSGIFDAVDTVHSAKLGQRQADNADMQTENQRIAAMNRPAPKPNGAMQ